MQWRRKPFSGGHTVDFGAHRTNATFDTSSHMSSTPTAASCYISGTIVAMPATSERAPAAARIVREICCWSMEATNVKAPTQWPGSCNSIRSCSPSRLDPLHDASKDDIVSKRSSFGLPDANMTCSIACIERSIASSEPRPARTASERRTRESGPVVLSRVRAPQGAVRAGRGFKYLAPWSKNLSRSFRSRWQKY